MNFTIYWTFIQFMYRTVLKPADLLQNIVGFESYVIIF